MLPMVWRMAWTKTREVRVRPREVAVLGDEQFELFEQRAGGGA